eukprot:CAMPEP_0116829322 /NCGR_PEP_ID=MMETSP0418-20121206/4146_1 /TAXON_ID=1158023 /ORGANISM="Astrosyne radiata, Strain 13vi08-1A" /LENGTH=168 /DNA_ID=CAMNT_0004458307 /DNA_START=595 /DNA_END=1101 /DNA_ORIENTATION=-
MGLMIFTWALFHCRYETQQDNDEQQQQQQQYNNDDVVDCGISSFPLVLKQLIYGMTLMGIFTAYFSSIMLHQVWKGVWTGLGTIDRMMVTKKKREMPENSAPIPCNQIFGISPVMWRCLPVDPVFPDYDLVMGYSMPQRLLRETQNNHHDDDPEEEEISFVSNGYSQV